MSQKKPSLFSPVPGRYVLAVSGGVDSMVMLDVFRTHHDPSQLIVAHFNHGVRTESDEDELFVRLAAESYGMEFIAEKGKFDKNASEAEMRHARYHFLDAVRRSNKAQAVATAHHQDDVIETAVINLLRGTGRRGLTSLQSTQTRYRPLLRVPKAEIVRFAEENKIEWREDSTNSQPTYFRNRIRILLEEKADDKWKRDFLTILERAIEQNERIDRELTPILLRANARHGAVISRSLMVRLPYVVASELVHGMLQRVGVSNISEKMVDRIVILAKASLPGKKLSLDKHHDALVTKRSLRIREQATHKTVRV